MNDKSLGKLNPLTLLVLLLLEFQIQEQLRFIRLIVECVNSDDDA